MSRNWRSLVRWTLLALSAAGIALPALAATPNQQRREAEQIVSEALFHESLGLNVEREKLLAEAERASPDAAAVRWARGQVKHNDRWLDAEELPQLLRTNSPVARYEKKRGEYPDTAAGQWSLARYCQRSGLDQQARAHLVRVLELSPNHAEARRELGFVAVENRWVHQDDIRLAAELAKQSRENFDRWQKRMLDLQHDLTARAKAQREAAAKRLAAIDDPAAIPAIETLLCYQDAAISRPAVNTLGAMTAPEASLALARVSVYSPAPEVREAAAKFLHGRPWEQFVPNLLAAMTTVTEARDLVTVDADGRLLHQQVFVREGQYQSELLVRGTEYRRQYVGGGSTSFAAWQAGIDMTLQNADASLRLSLENINTQERNQRITQTLSMSTDAKLGLDPKDWWDWWNKYNDLQVTNDKPVAMQIALRSVTVLDGIPQPTGGGRSGGGGSSGGGGHPECFIAGTLVRTALGELPIERVRVGDLVLSQDIETGELAYKPVLKTTVTPAGPLMKVEVGNYETFECTGGHLFWVSGEGWKQARELKSGMPLHTTRGAVTVSHVEPRAAEKTFNLVVADFHTYFAGERPVLCHDNTLRSPTRSIVPGVK
jgi:HEAT repeat protein